MLGRRSLPGDWRRARRGGEPATPRLLPPTVTARGEPRAGPQGSRWLTSEGASKGKALTHSKSGPAFVLASVHTLPPRVTSYGHSRCSHWLHTPIDPFYYPLYTPRSEKICYIEIVKLLLLSPFSQSGSGTRTLRMLISTRWSALS